MKCKAICYPIETDPWKVPHRCRREEGHEGAHEVVVDVGDQYYISWEDEVKPRTFPVKQADELLAVRGAEKDLEKATRMQELAKLHLEMARLKLKIAAKENE